MSVLETVFETVKEFTIEYSKKIIQLFQNKNDFSNHFDEATHEETWYFSSEGKQVYDGLSSLSDKTHFFYNYLRVIEGKSNFDSASSLLFRIAYIMANSMVDSNLGFAGYPNILDENKNPFIFYATHAPRRDWGEDRDDDISLDVLDTLHEEFDAEKVLCFCDENEQPSDLYKIERDIILMFTTNGYYSKTGILNTYSRVLDYALGIDIDLERN